MKATRRQAREWAVQMLTAADMNPPEDILEFRINFWRQIKSLDDSEGGSKGKAVRGGLKDFTEDRFLGVMKDKDAIDAAITPFMEGWDLVRLGSVERAVLRMAVWELRETGIPSAIIINEAVDLINWYASPKGRLLINSVLDRYAKSIEGERAGRVAEEEERRSEEHTSEL